MARTNPDYATDLDVVSNLPAHFVPLDDRERAFVLEYPVDFNATQAAIRAGYAREATNPNSAQMMGARLLQRPEVVNALLTELTTRTERAQIEAGRILEELSVNAYSSIAHYEIDDYGNVKLAPGAPDKAIRAVSRIKKRIRHEKDADGNSVTVYETEVSLWNKNEALNMAMKHLGMFIDRKMQVTGTIEELYRALGAGAPPR